MPKVRAKDGVILHYDLHDFTDPWVDAPVLILQHGYSRSGSFWYNMIPRLARDYRVVCPDLRGMGRSSRDFDLMSGISLDNFVNDLDSIVDHLGVDPVHYAGESFGGMMGFVYAAKYQTKVRSLCTFAAPMFISQWLQKTFAFDHPSWEEAIRAMGAAAWVRAGNSATRFPPGTDPGLMGWYASEMAKTGADAMIAMSRVAAKVDVRPFLKDVKVPVLGLYPTGGSITTNEHEEALQKNIADLKIIHLPTKFHMIQVIEPDACARYLLHFLALIDGRPCHA